MAADTQWDEEYDVVVVGTGNGGLTAAVLAHDGGAKVLVIEKGDTFGGTSASSGGGVWVPCNRYAKEAGAEDSLEEARDYLHNTVPADKVPRELLDLYIEQGPKMVDYLHEHTQVKYRNLPHYPDYFPEAPGGKGGNRSMEPEPLHASALGDDFHKLQAQHWSTQMPGGVNFTQVEGQLVLAGLPGWFATAAKLVVNYMLDIKTRLKTLRDGRLTMGNAGVARLYLSLQDRKVPLWLNTPMHELIETDGRVTGITATRNGRAINIRANKGVILAAGGFERNQEMREQYLQKPTKTEWSAAHMLNTGDAITAAMKLGAATHQMDWAWWFTTAKIPSREKSQMSQVEKGMPGSLCVNKDGKRFSNESQNYVTFVEEMLSESAAGNPCVPCFMLFDADFRRQRPVAALVQGKFMPDWMIPKAWWSPSFLSKANSLEELAQKVGIDPAGLQAEVQKFNDFARTGKDLDFKRGDSDYDRYYADPNVKPNPCLAPLQKAPFYAIALSPGEMGTAGGLVIDKHGRVEGENGAVIPGLYACGNTTTALLPTYPGPGSTLGPSMTFGYLAGKHVSGNA